MKKSPRKLQLHRETLHRLQTPELHRIHGGTAVGSVICPTIDNTCDFTCDLCITVGGGACPTTDCS